MKLLLLATAAIYAAPIEKPHKAHVPLETPTLPAYEVRTPHIERTVEVSLNDHHADYCRLHPDACHHPGGGDVPEPGTWLLIGGGLLALVWRRW